MCIHQNSFSTCWKWHLIVNVHTATMFFLRIGLTEVSHIAHFWVSYGRCSMPGLPMGWSEGLSWWWAD